MVRVYQRLKFIGVFVLAGLFADGVSGQARMVIKDDAYVVLKNSVYLVLDNPNANALTISGTGANIVSELETNRVKWNIATTTGNYTVPFTDGAGGDKIPVSVNITSAGTGATGAIQFSTYDGADFDNNGYLPSAVTHISNDDGSVANNSANVIDRFWLIDPINYSARPTPTISFNYSDPEHSAVGNTIVESRLRAQRFNDAVNKWYDLAPMGVANTASNVVNAVSVTPANFFKTWTLVDGANPLPITLLDFAASCEGNQTYLSWVTASEINNSHFVIEKSYNAIDFFDVDKVLGAGNSNNILNYSFLDPASAKTSVVYYRLKQLDFNGEFSYSNIVSSSCFDDNSSEVDFLVDQFVFGDGSLQFNIASSLQGKATVVLRDYTGKLVSRKQIGMAEGATQVNFNNLYLSKGIYMVSVVTDTEKQFATKLFYK